MKNTFKYIFAAFAALSLAANAAAQTDPDPTTNWSAIKTSKDVKANSDGSYTLTLETFVTGYANNTVTHVSISKPLDVVLVLDMSGSMDEYLKGYISRGANKSYSPSDVNSKGYYYLHTDGNYYEVKRGGNSNSSRNIYFNVGNTTWYLKGTGATRTSYTQSNSTTAFTGELYEYKATSTKKIDALKTAVNSFVGTIASQSDEKAMHQISIVKFASDKNTSVGNDTYKDSNYSNYYPNYSQVVLGLTDAKSSSIASAISSLSPEGATRTDYGMELAADVIANIPADRSAKSKKLVVMFTDGQPTTNQNFENAVANAAIEAGKTIKDAGVDVYTVGVFDEETSNISKFMNYVSSNYPNAASMTNAGSAISDLKYYMTATSAEELNNVFETIADEISDGSDSADVTLTTSDVVVKDIVTESFVIPDADGSVTLEVATVKSIDDSNPSKIKYEWNTPTAASSSVGYIISEIETENGIKKSLDVTGYDFSANWVGFKEFIEDGVVKKRDVQGSKLIITITVLPDPTAKGGPVKTNDPESGVYVNGKNNNQPVAIYDVPATQFTPMDLEISLSGLAKDESSIFEITRKSNGTTDENFKMIVVITSDGEETAATTLSKLPVKDDDGNVYEYTVTPTSWAWKYQINTADDSASHYLYQVIGEDDYESTNIFNFKATKADDAPTNNAEAVKKNEFEARN